jgi:hypothetical protein
LKILARRFAIAAIAAPILIGIAIALHTQARANEPSPKSTPMPAIQLASATIDEVGEGLSRVVVLSPKAAEHADATHAALLITSQSYSGRISFEGRVQTVRQIRTGSEPNPWECAWMVWNYTDDEHFYYIALKPNGWELGKRDPAYPGGQRFLASGEDVFPIGAWHSFAIIQENARIVVRLNGVEVASFTDTERPYLEGRLGLYSEDAEVLLDNITAPFAEDFESYELLTEKVDGFIVNRWVSPFLGHGYVAIADRKR